MDMATLINSGSVRVVASASSKKRLMHQLSEIASSQYELSQSEVFDALMDREDLGSTAVGNGVALPHARLEGIDRVVGVLILLDKPMDFKAVDQKPVDLIFALFAPKDSGVEHLKALALVSRTLRDNDVCAKLRSNKDPATIYTILTESPSDQAA